MLKKANQLLSNAELEKMRAEIEDLKTKNLELAMRLVEVLSKIDQMGEPLPSDLQAYVGVT
jgi:uncharacterized coiled-coil DUF342 family protein